MMKEELVKKDHGFFWSQINKTDFNETERVKQPKNSHASKAGLLMSDITAPPGQRHIC